MKDVSSTHMVVGEMGSGIADVFIIRINLYLIWQPRNEEQ